MNKLELFKHDVREHGLSVAWYNQRFMLASWILGHPKRMSIIPRKK